MASIWSLAIAGLLINIILWQQVPVQGYGSHGNMTVVQGSVYCDQCLEGRHTFWGLPLSGAKVRVECLDRNGQVRLEQEGVANMLGFYAIQFEGFPNMDGCRIRPVSSPSSSCNLNAAAASPRPIVSGYVTIDGLRIYIIAGDFFTPPTPSLFCQGVPSLPPFQSSELSACSHQQWLNPQYKCFWRVWSRDTKVSDWYGVAAANKFGADLTLQQGLEGSDHEPHQLLLREAITATLNALNSLKFYYNAVQVDYYFNEALAGTAEDVVNWAFNFRRANSGFSGQSKCLLTPCSSS